MLTVMQGRDPTGWCQWYRWADYPAQAAAMGARGGEAGVDFAIGDPAWIGRGADTELIAVLVAEVRRQHPGAAILLVQMRETPDPGACGRRTASSWWPSGPLLLSRMTRRSPSTGCPLPTAHACRSSPTARIPATAI
jgi:hypothetical protein